MSIHLLSLLKSATSERHAKAVQGLSDGTLTVSIKHQSPYTLRAIVTNGDGVEYGVHLGGGFGASCDCPDFCWRGEHVTCKHALAVCLYALQPPAARADLPEQTTPVTEKIHLAWQDDTILCGATFHANMRLWKRWTPNALNWTDIVCLDCVKTWTDPRSMEVAA